MQQQRHLKIEGKVQGVGYRNWLAKQADALAVKGYVQNSSDGSVDAVVMAEAEVLDALIERCWQGPSRAEVTAIQQKQMTQDQEQPFQDFQIRRVR